MIFINNKIGWITTISSREGYVGLYQTKDGGNTWRQQNLNVPNSYSKCLFKTFPPIFFSLNDAILLTEQNDIKPLVFITHDGGKNWTASTIKSKDSVFKWSYKITSNNSVNYWNINYKKTLWQSSNGFTWNVSK